MALAAPVSGGLTWIAAVNVVIWTGLFLYLVALDARIRKLGRDS